jgi:hypothetical protein
VALEIHDGRGRGIDQERFMDGRMQVAFLGAFFLQVGCDRSRGGGTDPVAPEVGLPMLAAGPKSCQGEPCAEPAAVESPAPVEPVAAKDAGPYAGCGPARVEAERAIVSLAVCFRVANGSGGKSDFLAILERVHTCPDDACKAAAEADLAKLVEGPGNGADAGADPEPCRAEREATDARIAAFRGCADAAWASEVDAAIRKMDEFAASMCDCRGKECAERVADEMTQYGEMLSERNGGKPEPMITPDQKRRMEEATNRLMECTTRAMGG